MAALADYIPFLRRNRAQSDLADRTRSGLVASAAPLNIGDRTEAKRIRVLRQGWQIDAWSFHDTIGEIRFARRYLANSARRMRLYPAVYETGSYDDTPQPVDESAFLPPEVVAACQDALTDLGSGRLALSQILYDTSSQLSIAGEGYIHGHTDPADGSSTWRVRSIGEIMVRTDEYVLREIPLDAMGVFGWHPLDPDLDYVSRIWTPHPQFHMLADSSMRSILDSCEELLILSRTVRATGRSRLAGAGILKVPEGLSVSSSTNDNLDPESDPFISALTEAMLTPIGDEGTASAVVPLIVRGQPDALKAMEHLSFDRPIDATMMKQRDELIGRIATGIDLPKEVLTGLADLNHWSAWQVDDNTFRHHIEPHVQECVDCLTVGYFRAALEVDPRMQGANAAWISRLSLWYDPTDLVTHPDRSQDALSLHQRMVISDAALRTATGFNDGDEPVPLEKEIRMVQNTRTFPPAILEALFHKLDPLLVIPATAALPGEGPSGATPIVSPTPSPAPVGPPVVPGPPPMPTIAASAPTHAVNHELSRNLINIDRELRARLQAACSNAVHTVLMRAGARVRTKVQKDERLRVAIAHTPNHVVAATLGQPIVATLGLTGLLDTDWSDVSRTFDPWTMAAQARALEITRLALNLAPDDPAVRLVEQSQGESRRAAWDYLNNALTALTHERLYTPDPNIDVVGGLESSNPDTLVPPGLLRSVLNIAGGGNAPDSSAIFSAPDTTMTLSGGDPLGQIGTGDDISGLLTDNGASVESYTWVHGFALKPFPPHEALDGVEFQNFDDDVLMNPDSFPAVEAFLPGDHQGCFPAGVMTSGPTAVGATLRDWQGEMIKITFASGQFLTATPNHPVLTPHGWVPFGQLDEGDEVVRCIDTDGIASLIPHGYQMPARIEEVSDSFGVSGEVTTASVKVSTEDFHGDGTGSEVAIVRTDRNLRDRIDATLSLSQPSGDCAPVNAEELGQGIGRLARFVSADKVLYVERTDFSGQVFNLDTRVGWYVANGIVVHNCSCDVQPAWALPLDENYTAGFDAPGSLSSEGDGSTPTDAASSDASSTDTPPTDENSVP